MKKTNKQTPKLVVIKSQCGGNKGGRGCQVEILPTMIRKAA